MTSVEAKLSIRGKRFEILVDPEKAVQLKRGLPVSIDNVLVTDDIYYDIKKGLKASIADLKTFFGTDDIKIIAEKIIKQGEVNVPAEFRKAEQENKIKQVVDFLSRNAVDPATGKPHTQKRIETALQQAGVNIENKPIDQQISGILDKLRVVLPIKIETKRLKILVPAVHTGKVYNLLKDYKEKEEWLSNGDLQCIINLPAGLQLEFYDKLNGITHGSSLVEEIK